MPDRSTQPLIKGTNIIEQQFACLRPRAASCSPTWQSLPKLRTCWAARRRHASKFLKWAHGALNIEEPISGDLPRIVAILEKYSDLRPDFADASLVALCERIDTRRIATINGDFKVYRTLSKKPFENVFDVT